MNDDKDFISMTPESLLEEVYQRTGVKVDSSYAYYYVDCDKYATTDSFILYLQGLGVLEYTPEDIKEMGLTDGMLINEDKPCQNVDRDELRRWFRKLYIVIILLIVTFLLILIFVCP